MSLYTRLIGLDEPKLSVHDFHALAHEVKRGRITGTAAATAFGLSPAEVVEAQAVLAQVVSGALTAEEVHQILILAESGLFYGTEAALKARLGV